MTDPIAPKPLFDGSRKVSVSQIRKKYSNSKPKANATKDETEATRQSTPTVPEKAVQILGFQPVEEIKRNTSPAAVPAKNASDPFRILYDTPPAETVGPTRQVQSTPVPTRRYLRENGLPNPTLVETSDVAEHRADCNAQDGYKGPLNAQEHMGSSWEAAPSKAWDICKNGRGRSGGGSWDAPG